MGKAVKIRNVKITSLNDVKHAKEMFKYEAKVNEQALLSGFNHFGDLVRISARKSAQKYGQKLLVYTFLKLLKSRFRK